MFKAEWEETYSNNSFRNKNEYPSDEVVSFLMQKFGKIRDKSKIKVLDLGCGWGNNLNFLKDKGFNYYGVDFSKSAINHCNKVHKNTFCCSLHNLPFDNNSFDVVIDRMAIQHNEYEIIKEAFTEVRRVLRSSGILFSILIQEGNYNFGTTYITKLQLENLTKDFSKVEIDFIKRSYKNRTFFTTENIVQAIK